MLKCFTVAQDLRKSSDQYFRGNLVYLCHTEHLIQNSYSTCTCAVKTKSLCFSLRNHSCECDDIASIKYKDLNYIMEEVIRVFP